MIFNEKISLEEIDGQKFKIRVIEPESNSNAVITHYLHNNKNGVSRSYKKDAIKFTKEILELKFPDEEITLKVAEEALQYGLFDTIDIPFPPVKNPKFTFIDLFAGIGGFRLALQQIGGKCIFTSEWDKNAKKTYRANFGEIPFGDITKKSVKEYIPEKFDVLCAGFPCQPFSKGGFQNGFEDTRGTLFFDICEIVEKHQPKFILLENVSNLVTHDNGNTYKVILDKLENLGYSFPNEPLIISPDKFGVPVLRPRIYIPCVRNDLAVKNLNIIQNFKNIIEKYFTDELQSIDTIIDESIPEDGLSEYEMKILNLWNDFYKGINLQIIGFPIWADYFKFDGDLTEFPEWKAKFILKNTELYKNNKIFIDKWLKKNDNLSWAINTHKKMEWQAGKSCENIFETLIQFRPSGVRIKKADKFSTLVAMNHQQIIGKLKRKISIEESKLLQSFPKEYILNKTPSIALKQLGNAVNVSVVQNIFKVLKKEYYD